MVVDAGILSPVARKDYWSKYLDKRNGTFEFRCRRYAAVYKELLGLRLNSDRDLVVDVGAGGCEFVRYLYALQGFKGKVQTIDGAIDGTDLSTWEPQAPAEFFVAIEVAEHLRNPVAFLEMLRRYATKGVVITTPNPDAVDVLGMDETHTSEITEGVLWQAGFATEITQLFHTPQDTIVAWAQGAHR